MDTSNSRHDIGYSNVYIPARANFGKVKKSLGALQFRDRLVLLFAKSGLTQAQLAERVEAEGVRIVQGRVSTVLSGKSRPTLAEIEVLARALRVDPAYLAFNEGKGAVEGHRPELRDGQHGPKLPRESAGKQRKRGTG